MRIRPGRSALAAVAALGAVVALSLSTARADDECDFSVDFEDFHPELRACGNEFELIVEYEIEFDHSSHSDHFTLVLEPSECARPLVDSAGKPLSFVVPLDCPKKWKGKDRDYEGTARFNIAGDTIHSPDDVRVLGTVLLEGQDAPVARKDKRAKFHGHDDYAIDPGPPVMMAAPVVYAAPPPVVYVQPQPVLVAHPRPVVVVHRRPVVLAHPAPVYGHHRVVYRGW
jgi:hypothetical protein